MFFIVMIYFVGFLIVAIFLKDYFILVAFCKIILSNTIAGIFLARVGRLVFDDKALMYGETEAETRVGRLTG